LGLSLLLLALQDRKISRLAERRAVHFVPSHAADGHHRICASGYCDEDSLIACCVAELPAETALNPDVRYVSLLMG
jgi:hypothetical protein